MNEKKMTVEIDNKLIQLELWRRQYAEVKSVKGIMYVDTLYAERIHEDDLPSDLQKPWELQRLYRIARSLGNLQETVLSLEGFDAGRGGYFSPARTRAIVHIARAFEVEGMTNKYDKNEWVAVKMP